VCYGIFWSGQFVLIFFRIKELLITCSAGMSLSHTNQQRRAWWLRILLKPTDFTHKHLTIKYDLVGEKPATKCRQNNQVHRKEKKKYTASHDSPYFPKVPKRKGVNHLIFQPKFTVSPFKFSNNECPSSHFTIS